LVHARAQQHAFCICVVRRQKEKREKVWYLLHEDSTIV
jgi:hypothetical protein